jgi:hypothetical protein
MVEYDMDSEDEAWLSSHNEERKSQGLVPLSEDDFEMIIDRLEKESFQQDSLNANTVPHDAAEHVNCCICNDGTSDDTNQIVFCDGCDIGVHQGKDYFQTDHSNNHIHAFR